jgi:hydrogenase maturation protease
VTVSDTQPTLLLLGLGNLLCGDDGLGVVAVELLGRFYHIPNSARVLDGGTLGLSLLSPVRDADDVILIDAISADGPTGSFVRLEGDEVAPAVRSRLSVHQIGVADLLDTLRLLEAYPRRLVLLGLVPGTLELGHRRSSAVERQIPFLVGRIAEEAKAMGYPLRLRRAHEMVSSATCDPALAALGM